MAKGFLLRSLPFTASTVDALDAGTAAAFTANDFMGMVVRRNALSSTLDIVLDLGSAQPVDTIAILNAVAPPIIGGWYIRASATNNFAAPDYSLDLTIDGAEALSANGKRQLTAQFPSQTYRYWRVSIASSSVAKAEIARILIGARVQPGRNFSFGVARGARDLGEMEFSPRGAQHRRRARKLRTLALGWEFETQAEAEAISLPFLEDVGETEFVLACLNPDADTQRGRRLYFGPLEGNLSMTWRANDVFEKRLALVSVI